MAASSRPRSAAACSTSQSKNARSLMIATLKASAMPSVHSRSPSVRRNSKSFSTAKGGAKVEEVF